MIDQFFFNHFYQFERKRDGIRQGNKQKIGIVLTFAPETELLIVDEPTSGLDPFITAEYYKILYEQQKDFGTTVLLSSHLLGEVEKWATILLGGITGLFGIFTIYILNDFDLEAIESLMAMFPEGMLDFFGGVVAMTNPYGFLTIEVLGFIWPAISQSIILT
ncbi:unnamed protein product [marine sediment metagenome]|uniref:ATPase AAA-type core domain-containing protein n=1 Tax=marine sediment metagenome TaxID=412755 RepID=X1T4L4_9ZZZZ